MHKILRVVMLGGLVMAVSACSTWEGMSTREKSMVSGVAVGAVAGNLVSNHSAWATVGGAALGGLAGDQIGKAVEKKKDKK
ncbi:glycine zipper domain-containing protein [Wohlfahrtiimonas larvae]|uniref:Glycine zipper 2TM domain-containing protein n=1 Tax=Wohlfahrtiimonas larvae TaxID=1157986 RepID=A0ABP9MW17_9GAMM|nr:glycine zipper 2TM domain-containing protein [Wohlfahrtiimonas larvae]